MGDLLRTLAMFVGLGVIAYPVFAEMRERASRSRRARALLMIRSGLLILAAVVMIVWLPRRVPETPGSPGTLVAIALIWVLGGSLIFMSLAAFTGAWAGRPRD